MKTIYYDKVKLTSGYLFDKQELNQNTTINAVYDRFYETGRIGAFNFDYKEGDEIKPHIFWDSDVAKWMEGVAYIIRNHPSPELEAKVDALVENIKKNQCEDGYFNIYFTVCEPEERFTHRGKHELYCAGHLMEAAVAYAETTGKTDFLHCMEKYADLINRVFVEEKSAKFLTPGHEEIELALVRMYRYTGKKKYLDMAKHFIDTRGTEPDRDLIKLEQYQCHKPVREQDTAVGHAVRAMYLYAGMAMVAKETGDEALVSACERLWNDATQNKMYITGGIGSTYIGEAFTKPFDLPNDGAYTETCAGIGLIFFANAMLALKNEAKYADVIERVLYNGLLSGLSLDGISFFYENPLEINLLEHFDSPVGKRKFPITQRVECFDCSCCPPNINRFLSSLGNYIYGLDGDTLYINQFMSSTLSDEKVKCIIETDYPRNGAVKIKASDVKKVAVRVPYWCESFKINKQYTIENGYAIVENDGSEIVTEFDVTPKAVWSDTRIFRNAGRVAVTRGPVVYCAEGVDNGGNDMHRFRVVTPLEFTEKENAEFGLPTLDVTAYEVKKAEGTVYSSQKPEKEKTVLRLIPYNCFANRSETDMSVWLIEN